MAPTIGRVALDNGFHGSIPGDWVAPPPQNIQSPTSASQTPAKKDSGPPTASWAIDSRHGQTTACRSEQSHPFLIRIFG